MPTGANASGAASAAGQPGASPTGMISTGNSPAAASAAAAAAFQAAARLSQVLWIKEFTLKVVSSHASHAYSMSPLGPPPRVFLLGARAEPAHPAFLTLTDEHRLTNQHVEVSGGDAFWFASEADASTGSTGASASGPGPTDKAVMKAVQLQPGQQYNIQVGRAG